MPPSTGSGECKGKWRKRIKGCSPVMAKEETDTKRVVQLEKERPTPDKGGKQ